MVYYSNEKFRQTLEILIIHILVLDKLSESLVSQSRQNTIRQLYGYDQTTIKKLHGYIVIVAKLLDHCAHWIHMIDTVDGHVFI